MVIIVQQKGGFAKTVNAANGRCGLQRKGQLNTNVPIQGSIRIQIQTVLQIQIQSNIVFRLLAKSRYNANVYKIQI